MAVDDHTHAAGLGLAVARLAASVLDANANEIFKITSTASAVNEWTLANAATGADPLMSATGGDTNIGLAFQTKGTGIFTLESVAGGTTGSVVNLLHDGGSAADDDDIAVLRASGDDDGNNETIYGEHRFVSVDVTDTEEDGKQEWWNMKAGTLTLAATLSELGSWTMVGPISVDDTTDTTSGTTGSIHTDGGLGAAKDIYVGGALGIGVNANEAQVAAHFAKAISVSSGDVYQTQNAATLTVTGGSGNLIHHLVQPVGSVINSGGAHNVITAQFSEPVITETSGTANFSANIYVPGSASEATNNYAIFVDAGNVRLDGNISLLTDNGKVSFGAADDASIFYNGTHLVLEPADVGSGSVQFNGPLRGESGTLVLEDTNTRIDGNLVFGSGSSVALVAGAGNRLDLATGDSFYIVGGQLGIGEAPSSARQIGITTSLSEGATTDNAAVRVGGTYTKTAGASGQLIGIESIVVPTIDASATTSRVTQVFAGSVTAVVNGTLSNHNAAYLGTPVNGTTVRVIDSASGAFLTTGGVWTDNPSWAELKEDIVPVDRSTIGGLLDWFRDSFQPVSYRYKDRYETYTDDNGRQARQLASYELPSEYAHFGYLLDDLPQNIREIVGANAQGGISGKDERGLLFGLVQELALRVQALEVAQMEAI